jgi:predicted ArsR family transcriptional regulator
MSADKEKSRPRREALLLAANRDAYWGLAKRNPDQWKSVNVRMQRDLDRLVKEGYLKIVKVGMHGGRRRTSYVLTEKGQQQAFTMLGMAMALRTAEEEKQKRLLRMKAKQIRPKKVPHVGRAENRLKNWR